MREREAEAAAREQEVADLMETVQKTYVMLASQNTEDDVLRKPELIKAHGGKGLEPDVLCHRLTMSCCG